MIRPITLLAAVAIIAASISTSAFSQGAPQVISLMTVDLTPLATGYRVSKVLGGTVVNSANEVVGTVDDLIVTPNEKVPFVILSVGGFLGVGNKLVVVSFSAIEVHNKQMVFRDATKAALMSLPPFTYSY